MAEIPEEDVSQVRYGTGRIIAQAKIQPGEAIGEHAAPDEPGWLVVIEYQQSATPGRTGCRGYRYTPEALVLETNGGTEIYPVPGNLIAAHFYRDRDSGR